MRRGEERRIRRNLCLRAGWNEEGQRGPKDDQIVGVVDVPDSAKTNSRTPDENQKLGGRLLLYRAGFPVRVAKDQRGHTGFAVAHTALATPFTVPAPSSCRPGIGPLHQVLLQAASLTCPIGPVNGWRAKVGSSVTHFYRRKVGSHRWNPENTLKLQECPERGNLQCFAYYLPDVISLLLRNGFSLVTEKINAAISWSFLGPFAHASDRTAASSPGGVQEASDQTENPGLVLLYCSRLGNKARLLFGSWRIALSDSLELFLGSTPGHVRLGTAEYVHAAHAPIRTPFWLRSVDPPLASEQFPFT
ncbi:conserved hypothetical protein [Histoplasma capsulatum var. duboisii H88]|uniref:Uncharacterized protein n=1 Tax=Ajellomyces capsulatus (strain H88) TaxID=544711 RepID=F0U8K4_AJEC8|nr:conserved hypothetical protein [Histoplasma capsulatum var. duboisii H88]